MDSNVKFGLISFIFRELNKSRLYYGKIVIQKILYFLQETENVNLNFRFTFYHYGPYSEELARDIQLMELNGLINSSVDPKGMGYSIHLNEEVAQKYIEQSRQIIDKNSDKIARILSDFGRFKPKFLELYATIHFVYQDLRSINVEMNASIKDNVIDIVKKMKPKFTSAQISKSYDKLLELEYIK
ncbi:MAG TPA: hypothetical protein VGB37_03755 [Candidatus Lokiarchaeia archaeon]